MQPRKKQQSNNKQQPNQKRKPKRKVQEGPRTLQVSLPAVRTTINSPPPAPVLKTFKRGGVKIRHSEFVGNVISTVDFGGVRRYINPARASTFPWLPNIAASFETYNFNKMSWEYRPSVGTTATGKVILAVDYDATDSDFPQNKNDLLQMQCEMDGPPWQPFTLNCDRADLQKVRNRYTAMFATTTITNSRNLYDVGIIWVATEGYTAAGSIIGELWCHYEVELSTPQPIQGSPLSCKFVATTPDPTNPMGTDAALITGPTVIYRTSGTTATFGATGDFLIVISITGTGLATWSFAASTATFSVFSQTINAAATAQTIGLRVQALELQTLVAATAATALSAVTIRVAPYDYHYQ